MGDLLHNFGVNWKLLLAQIVNFGILFFVLKRYAYGPVVAMLEERRAKIKKGLEDAAASEQALRDAEAKEDEIVEAANKRALATVAKAEDLAREKGAEIVKVAHEKAEAVAGAAERRMGEERAKMLDDIHHDAHELVELATARVLGRMEPDERDKALIREALDELKVVAKNM